MVSPVHKQIIRGKARGGGTCDDDQLGEDKEDVRKETEARQMLVRPNKGEERDGDNQERAEVYFHLPVHSVVHLEHVLEG